MTKKGCLWGWLAGTVGLLVIFLVTMILIESLLGRQMRFPTYGAHIGLVRIEGVISDSRDVIADLRSFEGDGAMKALVVRIDSPGGSVSASQEIYEEIVAIRETGIPVVVSMGAMAASGGYYVACPADTIVANAGTLTGSIGVIMSFMNLEELFGKVGVDFEVVKSGEYKDMGSMNREMTAKERELLQTTIDDIHLQFIEVVATERSLDMKSVREIADGRIFSGRQALERGLVDVLGTLDDAQLLAARMGGIKGEPRVLEPVKVHRLTLTDLLGRSVLGLLEPASVPAGAQYLFRPAK
jgi:protease-4